MKIIALGDTHGRKIWEDITKKELDSDKIVFLGDFFDTHDDETPQQQIENFEKIIEFKKLYPEKVVLLLGNHDFHYISGVYETYSGFNPYYCKEIGALLDNAIENNLIQICFKHDKYVFTHAGVTKTWARSVSIDIKDVNYLDKYINEVFIKERILFGFTMGEFRSYSGDDVTQTPIWVRLGSLEHDIYPNIVCVVGHTPQRNIFISDKIIAIDTLGESGEYLIIENNIPKIGE